MSDILTLLLLLWFLLIPPSAFMLVNGSPVQSQFVLDTVTPADYISTTPTNNSELSLSNPTLLDNGRLTLPAINCRKDEAEVTEDIAIQGGALRTNIDNSAVRRGACEERRYISYEDECRKSAWGVGMVDRVCWLILCAHLARL